MSKSLEPKSLTLSSKTPSKTPETKYTRPSKGESNCEDHAFNQRKLPSLTTALVTDFIERIKLCSTYSANVPSVFPLDRDPKDAKYIDLAFGAKADFLVIRDNDILGLRDSKELKEAFNELDWKFKIVDPFEMLSFFRDSSN